MECPSTGGQLQQLFCEMHWIGSAIPNFQALARGLHEFMERVYKHAQKRTKRAVSRKALARVGWTPHHANAFLQDR